MKKRISFVIIVLLSVSIYSQVDYSIFLQKKINKKDRSNFTDLSKFKKHNYSKCLKGNCKNGKSLLKQSFLMPKKRYGNGQRNPNKNIVTILIDGMFKNGKLNGEAALYYYPKFYYNEKAQDNGVFSNNRDILANTGYSECVKGIFKDNIITKGEYIIKIANSGNNKTLMNVSGKLDFRTYFSDWETRKFSKNFNAKSLLSYKYIGSFKSLNEIDGKEFEKLVLFYAAGNFTSNWDDKYTITIKPLKKENTYEFTQKIKKYAKTILTKPKVFSIVNGECDGCWLSNITLDEHKEYLLKKKQKRINNALAEKKHQLELKINRTKSLVGHFVEKFNVYYYINKYDAYGCLYGNIYPTRAYYEKDYVAFFNACNPENFNIMDNAGVCQNCKGWGTENVNVTYNTTYYTKDAVGNKTYDKSPSRSNTVIEKHSCHICKGKGVVIN